MFTSSSYTKSLYIRPNVRLKACVKSRCRRRMKNDRNPTWLRQTPSAIVSPRFAFSDRGAPGDFNVGFRFCWSHLAVCYIPVPRRQDPVGPSPPFSFMGPSTSIRFRIGPVGPPLSLPFEWHPPPPPPACNGNSDGGLTALQRRVRGWAAAEACSRNSVSAACLCVSVRLA